MELVGSFRLIDFFFAAFFSSSFYKINIKVAVFLSVLMHRAIEKEQTKWKTDNDDYSKIFGLAKNLEKINYQPQQPFSHFG